MNGIQILFPRRFPVWAVTLFLAWVAGFSAGSAAPQKRDWRIFSTPHFDLLTDGSTKQAEVALERLERYRAAAIRMQGEQLVSRLPVRVYLLLSSDEFDWMRAAAGPQHGVIGMYQPARHENLLAVSSVDDKESEGRVLLHEYTHLLLRGYQADWPLWLSEGFAQVLETVELRDDRATFGKYLPFGTLYLQRKGLMPMADLFRFKLKSDVAVSPETLTHVYLQSWAVCQYLYFGVPENQEAAALQFVNDVGHGVPVETALKQRLNLTPEQLQKKVQDHIYNGRVRSAGYKLPDDVRDLKPPRVRPAEPGEADAWLGDWAIELDPSKAEARYQASLAQAPGNPYGLAGLGRCLGRAGEYPKALEALSRAAEAQPQSGWVWLYLASVSNEATRRSKTNGTTHAALPPGTLEAIQRARDLLPSHPSLPRELGRALALKGARLQEVVDAYGQAATLDPADLRIPMELALQLYDRGQKDPARRLLKSVIARSGNGVVGNMARWVEQKMKSEAGPTELPVDGELDGSP